MTAISLPDAALNSQESKAILSTGTAANFEQQDCLTSLNSSQEKAGENKLCEKGIFLFSGKNLTTTYLCTKILFNLN